MQWEIKLHIGTAGAVVIYFPQGNRDWYNTRITNKLIKAKYVKLGFGINFIHSTPNILEICHCGFSVSTYCGDAVCRVCTKYRTTIKDSFFRSGKWFSN